MSKENQAIIKAINMYGRVPEQWELLEEIERLNNIIKKLERLVDDNAWNNYYFKCGNRYLKSEILNDIREIIDSINVGDDKE